MLYNISPQNDGTYIATATDGSTITGTISSSTNGTPNEGNTAGTGWRLDGGNGVQEAITFSFPDEVHEVVLTLSRVADFETIQISINGVLAALDSASATGNVTGSLATNVGAGSVSGVFQNDFNNGTITLDLSNANGNPNTITIQNLTNTSTDADAVLTVDAFVCFAAGTLIETSKGEVLIENISVGDLIPTRDNGMQEVKWVGCRRISEEFLKINEKLRPIKISAGALGDGTPEKDLFVSRQHRILVKSKLVERVFNESEILLPAIKLITLDGIEIDEKMKEVEYYHILFDQHEIIQSNGAQTESLFTGTQALAMLPKEYFEEVHTIFPGLRETNFKPKTVRSVPDSGKKIKKFISRLIKNNKKLFQN